MNAKTTPTRTIDEMRAEMEALRTALADAEAAAVREAQAAAWDGITPVLEAVQAAVANRDAAATATATQDLSTFVKSAFGTRRTGNGTPRTPREGDLADLIPAYLAEHPDSTPGTIGRDLGRSAGAVSAAIQRPTTGLVAKGTVIETSPKPRRYALA